MKRIFVLVLVTLSLLSACSAAKGIEISEAWARPAAQGKNGAIYFVIHNHAREADELTGVSSDIAEAVELHESRMDGDVMQMRQLESVPLQANAETIFKPGGLHVMLIGMKKDTKIGDEIEIVLHLKNFGDIEVSVPVKEAPASGGH
ncbi:MAG: copper chaperone PCu(A)C [Anaerolineales bacterium]|nr:copper chaperone PCu(A)C [Anaerolineales bacterium]